MKDPAALERLELHIEATGRGRRLAARLPDGTVLATGRNYRHLMQNIKVLVKARFSGEVKIALLVGSARRPDDAAPKTPQMVAPRLPG
jgi:hypothetical protein